MIESWITLQLKRTRDKLAYNRLTKEQSSWGVVPVSTSCCSVQGHYTNGPRQGCKRRRPTKSKVVTAPLSEEEGLSFDWGLRIAGCLCYPMMSISWSSAQIYQWYLRKIKCIHLLSKTCSSHFGIDIPRVVIKTMNKQISEEETADDFKLQPNRKTLKTLPLWVLRETWNSSR